MASSEIGSDMVVLLLAECSSVSGLFFMLALPGSVAWEGSRALIAAIEVGPRRHSGVPISEPIPRAAMGTGRRWALAPTRMGLGATMKLVALLTDLMAAPGEFSWPVLDGHLGSACVSSSLIY